MAKTYTEEQLNDLTEAEREALDGEVDGFDDEGEVEEEEQDDDTQGAGTEKDGTDDDDAGKGKDGKADGDDAGKAGTEGEGEGDAGTKDDKTGDGKGAADKAAQAQDAPLLRADAPDKAKLEALETRESELEKAFEDGDMSAGEFRKALREVERQRADINEQSITANIAQRLEEQRIQNQWNSECAVFMAEHKTEYGAHAKLRTEALNNMVIEIARSEEGQSLSGPDILDRAHKAVLAELGPVAAKAADTATTGKAGKTPLPKKELPPTLNGLPAAAATEANGESRFAALERLATSDPLAYERAVSKLSDADREAYEAGA